MPRMRTLKPEFWVDTKMMKLSPHARLFYMGMWNYSICHNGHLDDDAEELKWKILPADDVDAGQLLSELLEMGRVKRCVADDGRTYLWIPTLTEHQNIDPRWKPRCRYCALSVPPVLAEPQQTTYEDARASPSHIQGQDGMGREGTKNPSPPATPPRASDDDPNFARFWQAYPKRTDKGHARKAWAKAIKNGTDPAAVIAGAEAFAGQCTRNRTEAKFIPYPATWLNGERWSDQGSSPATSSDTPWWEA